MMHLEMAHKEVAGTREVETIRKDPFIQRFYTFYIFSFEDSYPDEFRTIGKNKISLLAPKATVSTT